jgi:hypothetical protein
MFTPNNPQTVESGITGPMPAHWFGTGAIDGDAGYWIQVGKGSTYTRVDLTNLQSLGHWTKLKEDGRDDDWVEGLGVITETVALADFTDGGSTAGTYVLKRGIPQGAYVVRTILVNVTGFAGDTSATIQVGDGTDVDRYNTGTPSVFTTANAIDVGAVSGTAIHTAAANVTLTVTSGSDWGAVTAGQLTVRIYYYA